MGLFTITPADEAAIEATELMYSKLTAVRKARKAHKKAARAEKKTKK